ncbi:hypothetical protein APR04_002753 [Promicromonospora umidemergens]|uniref:Uncharacterized protein n=1 Tax=Promicromonospora umidemergens TaxID=629679 RepID=A0ABP8WKU5_9MICO|nr:hypothetical protein [Promicromonospora umidemergens]
MSLQNSLRLRYARNDLIKNKGVNIALAVVLVLSAFLMGTGAMVRRRAVRAATTAASRPTNRSW